MKRIWKKILVIVIVILLDISIFASCILIIYSLSGNKKDTYKERTDYVEEIETITEETTVNENRVLYEKSKSPLVNWMREIVRDIRE